MVKDLPSNPQQERKKRKKKKERERDREKERKKEEENKRVAEQASEGATGKVEARRKSLEY